MSGITIKYIKEAIYPDFIETLKYYYLDIKDNKRLIRKAPITVTQAYERYSDLIYGMLIPTKSADMLDEMMLNVLKHNSVINGKETDKIINRKITFDNFDEVYLYSLSTMFSGQVKYQFDIIEVNEQKGELYPHLDTIYMTLMRASKLILFNKTYELPKPIYVRYESLYDHRDKNKLFGNIFYNKDKKAYGYMFDEPEAEYID